MQKILNRIWKPASVLVLHLRIWHHTEPPPTCGAGVDGEARHDAAHVAHGLGDSAVHLQGPGEPPGRGGVERNRGGGGEVE